MYSIRSILIFFAVTGFFFSTYGQDQKQQALDYLKLADEMVAGSQADNDIRDVYVQAANLDPDNLKANFEAGYYHLKTIGKDLAATFFLRVYERDPNYRFDIEYWIGNSYHYGLQFDKAIDYYTRYLNRFNSKPNYLGRDRVSLEEVERNIQECENGKEFIRNPKGYSIVNLGNEINSEWDDYAPVLNANEDELIFTSRRRDDNLNQNVFDDNKPWEDIFISRKVNGKWQPAKNIGSKVNTIYHDSNLALSADGKTLFIHKDENGGDIYFVKLNPDGSWGAAQPLPGMVNSSYAEKSVSISQDERTLFFSSERPGGLGGLDIYKATVNSVGQWINVQNLGSTVNTPLDDDGPFIDYDGKTLYFSSKGHKGMGNYDIFKTVYDEATGEWSTPENLGYPINTPDNDIYFVSTKDGKRGYYSSIREDALGYDDIYMITLVEQPVAQKPPVGPVTTPDKPVQPIQYTVTVIDAVTREPVDARIQMQGAADNVVLPANQKGIGVMEFTIGAPESKEYRLSVSSEGYMFVNQNIRVEGATDQVKMLGRTVELRKVQSGSMIILRNIYFDFDKASFKPESFTELNKVERMMRENPNLQVEIAGHTDYIGSVAYNMTLSQRRAEAVKDYLTKKGIDPRRVVAKGYGKTRPIASNDDEEEGRELNRRVEFRVISN
jgi:outer membrane protein OmpA-like peptidoglycan-associated protein/tetratricopeptide (TPR) repeat protein